jgi:hypothetical protein
VRAKCRDKGGLIRQNIAVKCGINILRSRGSEVESNAGRSEQEPIRFERIFSSQPRNLVSFIVVR